MSRDGPGWAGIGWVGIGWVADGMMGVVGVVRGERLGRDRAA